MNMPNAGSMVSFRDYDSFGNGFGQSSSEDVQELLKALNAGSDINNPGTSAGSGFPLRVESLESTLKHVTYRMEHVKFWRTLDKLPAYNTAEEFNRIEAYSSGDAAWIQEGALPEEDDSTYSRNYAIVKYMGTTRKVSHPMTLVKPAHGDVIARETISGTMHLLRQAERSLFMGNADFIPEQVDGLLYSAIKAYGSALGPDGQYAGWDDTTNAIDMQGKPLSEDVLSDSAERVSSAPNYGMANCLWASNQAISDVSRAMFPKERFNIPGPVNGKIGIAVNGITTPFGDIAFKNDVFLTPGQVPNAAIVGDATKVPSALALGVAAAAAPDAASRFKAADAGDYIYRIVGVNRFGKTAPLDTAAVTVAAGDKVTFTVNSGATVPTAYEIYRTGPGGAVGTAKYLMTVAYTGAAQVITDINRFLPGTSIAFMTQQDSDVMAVKQLAPLLKLPLAVIDSSVRWMQLLYFTFQLYAPRKMTVLYNIGRIS